MAGLCIMCHGARKCHMYKTFKRVVNQSKGGPEKEVAEVKPRETTESII